MDYLQALNILESTDIHAWRYRELVESDKPLVRDAWRERVILMAGGEPKPPATAHAPAYPSVARQAWNAAKSAAGFAASGFAVVSQEEYARRVAICQEPCEHYDAGQGRCRKCGCSTSLKSRLASSHCPLSPPKW